MQPGYQAYQAMGVSVNWDTSRRVEFPYAAVNSANELCIMANIDSFITDEDGVTWFIDSNWAKYSELVANFVGEHINLIICKISNERYEGCTNSYVTGILKNVDYDSVAVIVTATDPIVMR